jgi:hypothetical protein
MSNSATITDIPGDHVHLIVIYLMKYGVSIWLGIMPGVFFGIQITNWKWWAIVVPVQALFGLSRYAYGINR